MPSAWSASTGKRGASAYASCARQVGTCVNAPEALGLTGRTHGVEHKGTGADSVGLPCLSSFRHVLVARLRHARFQLAAPWRQPCLMHGAWPQVKEPGDSLRRSRGLVLVVVVVGVEVLAVVKSGSSSSSSRSSTSRSRSRVVVVVGGGGGGRGHGRGRGRGGGSSSSGSGGGSSSSSRSRRM